MNRIISFLFLLSFFFTVSGSSAYGIDTKDWEGILAIQLFGAEPEKEWLLETTYLILKDAFPKKDKKYFEQFFDKESNSINVRIPTKWHDITEFRISYFGAKQGGHTYAVWYKFKKGAMTLLDILGRYGYKLADIETKEDLSKEIKYVLKSDMSSLVGKNPIWPLQPLNQGQVTILSFISKDGVFVNDLIISSHKPPNPSLNRKVDPEVREAVKKLAEELAKEAEKKEKEEEKYRK